MDVPNANPPQKPTNFQEEIVELEAKVHKEIQQVNSIRKPRTNALIIVGVILLGGFMAYNFVGKQLTQVASQSYQPAVATPKPTQQVSSTPSLVPTGTNTLMQRITPTTYVPE